MQTRRVYLDKDKTNIVSETLADLSKFSRTSIEYHDYTRYRNDICRGLFFSDTGTKMYMAEQNNMEINEYNLSTPWDITTATFNQANNFNTNNILLKDFCFNSSGTRLFLGGRNYDASGIDHDQYQGYKVETAWDITTIDQSEFGSLEFTSGNEINSVAYSPSNDFDIMFAAGHSSSGVTVGYVQWYNLVGISQAVIYGRENSRNDNVFIGTHGRSLYMMQSTGLSYEDTLIDKYTAYTTNSEATLNSTLTMDKTGSGLVGDPSAFFISPDGDNLYISTTSGVVMHYQNSNNDNAFYGSYNSGLQLQNLSTQPHLGDNSPSDYIDEGITVPNSSDFWTSVSSGTSYVNLTFEIPYMDNMSGITLEVHRDNFDELQLKKIGLYNVSDYLTDGTSTGSVNKYYSNLFNSGELILESGQGLASADLPNIITHNTTLGRYHNYELEFEIYSPSSGNRINALNLLMEGDVIPGTGTGIIPLYVDGILGTHNDIDLFLANYYDDSNVDLFIHGHTDDSGLLPLYIKGHTPKNDNIPLFMSGAPVVSNMTLYIPGGFEADNVTLYVSGHEAHSGDMTLFIEGMVRNSGDTTLYTYGYTTGSGEFPLYLDAGTQILDSANFPLFMYTDTTSGLYKSLSLSIGSDTSPEPDSNLNLYLLSVNHEDTSVYLPLVIGDSYVSSSGFDLIVYNNYTGDSGTIPMYLYSESYGSGREELPLYIHRDSEGIAHSVPLYMSGPSVHNEELTLYIEGSNSGVNENLSLFVSGVGTDANSTKLFTKGI